MTQRRGIPIVIAGDDGPPGIMYSAKEHAEMAQEAVAAEMAVLKSELVVAKKRIEKLTATDGVLSDLQAENTALQQALSDASDALDYAAEGYDILSHEYRMLSEARKKCRAALAASKPKEPQNG